MKVAKLVTVEVTTRVIVEDTATDEEIMAMAIPRCVNNLLADGYADHITDDSIVDDTECPYKGEFDCAE